MNEMYLLDVKEELHRVNKHVTTDVVLSHIKKQPGFENEKVDVKELPTKVEHLKNFLVTAPLERKNELYADCFWPAYVGIRSTQNQGSGKFFYEEGYQCQHHWILTDEKHHKPKRDKRELL